MVESGDAVRRPLALAHVMVEWLSLCHVSLEEQAAALDIAKRIYHMPRLGVVTVTEIAPLSSDGPILNQSSRGIDHRADAQVLDACQFPGN